MNVSPPRKDWAVELESIADGCYVDSMRSTQVGDRCLDLCCQLRAILLIACVEGCDALHTIALPAIEFHSHAGQDRAGDALAGVRLRDVM